MMVSMWRVAWLFVAGCKFTPGSAVGDALPGVVDGSADAAINIDAGLDAPPDGPPTPIMFQQGSARSQVTRS